MESLSLARRQSMNQWCAEMRRCQVYRANRACSRVCCAGCGLEWWMRNGSVSVRRVGVVVNRRPRRV